MPVKNRTGEKSGFFLLFGDKRVNAVDNLGYQVNNPVNGVVGGRRNVDHAHNAVFDHEESVGVNLYTGGVAAAVGTLTVLALCSELDPAAAETDTDSGNGDEGNSVRRDNGIAECF